MKSSMVLWALLFIMSGTVYGMDHAKGLSMSDDSGELSDGELSDKDDFFAQIRRAKPIKTLSAPEEEFDDASIQLLEYAMAKLNLRSNKDTLIVQPMKSGELRLSTFPLALYNGSLLLRGVIHIELSNNVLKALPLDVILQLCPHVATINASFNRLRTVTIDESSGTMKTALTRLDLSNNAFANPEQTRRDLWNALAANGVAPEILI